MQLLAQHRVLTVASESLRTARISLQSTEGLVQDRIHALNTLNDETERRDAIVERETKRMENAWKKQREIEHNRKQVENKAVQGMGLVDAFE